MRPKSTCFTWRSIWALVKWLLDHFVLGFRGDPDPSLSHSCLLWDSLLLRWSGPCAVTVNTREVKRCPRNGGNLRRLAESARSYAQNELLTCETV